MEHSYSLETSKQLKKYPRYSLAVCQLWLHRSRTRKQLHDLLRNDPQRLHHDLGLSTKAALVEINKPFWRG